MGAKGLPIRDDVPAAELRRLARREKDRAAAGVVHDLEEAEVERQACGTAASLRDAAVRPRPGAQQLTRTLPRC